EKGHVAETCGCGKLTSLANRGRVIVESKEASVRIARREHVRRIARAAADLRDAEPFLRSGAPGNSHQRADGPQMSRRLEGVPGWRVKLTDRIAPGPVGHPGLPGADVTGRSKASAASRLRGTGDVIQLFQPSLAPSPLDPRRRGGTSAAASTGLKAKSS